MYRESLHHQTGGLTHFSFQKQASIKTHYIHIFVLFFSPRLCLYWSTFGLCFLLLTHREVFPINPPPRPPELHWEHRVMTEADALDSKTSQNLQPFDQSGLNWLQPDENSKRKRSRICWTRQQKQSNFLLWHNRLIQNLISRRQEAMWRLKLGAKGRQRTGRAVISSGINRHYIQNENNYSKLYDITAAPWNELGYAIDH